MNEEQRRQYDSLTSYQQEDYDRLKSRHPTWSHEEIMARLAIQVSVENVAIPPGRKGPIDKDPEILKEVLQQAKSFLYRAECILSDVFEVIDSAIKTLSDLISRGINYVGDKLSEFWAWLRS